MPASDSSERGLPPRLDTPPITVFLWAWPPLSLLVASVGGHPLLAIGVTGVWTALQLTARGVL